MNLKWLEATALSPIPESKGFVLKLKAEEFDKKEALLRVCCKGYEKEGSGFLSKKKKTIKYTCKDKEGAIVSIGRLWLPPAL